MSHWIESYVYAQNRQNLWWRIIPLRGCIREIAYLLAINRLAESESATHFERYVTNGKPLIRSTDGVLDANESVNSCQERDNPRSVVSHHEDVGGTSSLNRWTLYKVRAHKQA